MLVAWDGFDSGLAIPSGPGERERQMQDERKRREGMKAAELKEERKQEQKSESVENDELHSQSSGSGMITPEEDTDGKSTTSHGPERAGCAVN